MPRITDPGKIGQALFDDASAVSRTAQSGIELTPQGPANVQFRTGMQRAVMVFNSGAAVAYVAFGDKTVTAPTGPANGIPVLPNEKAMLNSGDSEYMIGSAATLFLYTAPEV